MLFVTCVASFLLAIRRSGTPQRWLVSWFNVRFPCPSLPPCLQLATPARYTVTLGGTSLSVKYLRRHGYFCTPPPVKDYLQDRMEETKERLTEKMEETKGRLTEKMEETKDRFSEKLHKTKDKVSEGKTFFRKKTD